MNKTKEYWLEVGEIHPGIHLASIDPKPFANAPSIHVIEAAPVLAEVERLIKERDELLAEVDAVWTFVERGADDPQGMEAFNRALDLRDQRRGLVQEEGDDGGAS